MCDSFDMACRDASHALQLNIKVNSENLLPTPQKYNVGTLKVPADPSWPKIPQRRFADDFDDVIKPGCVVTLNGTPRKSRTTVRPSNSHQSSRSNFTKDQVPSGIHQNTCQNNSLGHAMKRRPGCADPRFKKVTTIKSQMTPTDSTNWERKNPTEFSRSAVVIPNQGQCTSEHVRKTVPEKNRDQPKVSQQEAEKPGEIRGMDSIGIQTMAADEGSEVDDRTQNSVSSDEPKIMEQLQKTEDSVDEIKNCGTWKKDACKTETSAENLPNTREDKCDQLEHLSTTNHANEQEIEKTNVSEAENPVSMNTATIRPNSNNRVNISQAEAPCLQYRQQGNGTGQFFLVVENKAQASPIAGSVQIETNTAPPCQYTTQCYNVQVPVLSYQNLPLQISTQQVPKLEIPSQLSLSSILTIPSTPIINNNNRNNTINHRQHPCGDTAKGIFSCITEVPESQTKETIDDVENDRNTKESTEIRRDKEKRDNEVLSCAETAALRTRKLLRTPPVRLERKQESNPPKISSDAICERFRNSRARHLVSDTTDSEIYSMETKEAKPSPGTRVYSKETSGSGSDYDVNTEHECRADEAALMTKKKPKNSYYCSTAVSHNGIIYSRNNDNDLSLRDRESSVDDRESSKPCQQIDSRTHRKMKSEQNLPRLAQFSGNNYKNISDPRLTTRESCCQYKDSCSCKKNYSTARGKNENRHREIKRSQNESFAFNRHKNDLTTDVDSDIPNIPESCDTHRTDLSNVREKTENPLTSTANETTNLPVKTQQLLNKSYLEYYDKLRSSSSLETAQQRFVSQMALGAPQLKKRKADVTSISSKIGDERAGVTEVMTMEKLSALSNIINRNLNPTLRNSSDAMQTKELYVNENMKPSSDPSATAKNIVAAMKNGTGNSVDLYDSSLVSSILDNRVKRKREKTVERRLLKLKTIEAEALLIAIRLFENLRHCPFIKLVFTIFVGRKTLRKTTFLSTAFFGFTMYAMIVLLPMMYTYFLYDEYEDYEDLSYIEFVLEYVVSSFREAFGGIFDAINETFFRPRTRRKCNTAP